MTQSTLGITGISWIFFRQIPGKPPKTVGFPGRPSAAIFRFKTSPRVGYGLKSYVMNHSMTCRSCGKPSNQSRLQPVSRSVHLGCSGSACEIPIVLYTQLYTASNYIPHEKYKHLQDSWTWYCLIDAGETKLLGGGHFSRLGNVGFDYGQLAGHTTFIHLPLLPQDPWPSRQN